MSLFTKKPIQTSFSSSLYTIGNLKTLLIIGLGNPGQEYSKTRHNIGFECLDAFRDSESNFNNWASKKDFGAEIAIGQIGSNRIILAKPQSYMNLSGQAASRIQKFYKIDTNDLIVVHDELDIQFGEIRIKSGGGSAGHNGLKSIIQHSGDDFRRIRIGICNDHKDKIDSSDFVLKAFSKNEQGNLPNLTKEVSSIISEMVFDPSLESGSRKFI